MGVFSSIVETMTGGLVSSGSSGEVEKLTPMDALTSVTDLSEPGKIADLASDLPDSPDEQTWLKEVEKAAEMEATAKMLSSIVGERKKQINAYKSMFNSRLDARKHGMTTAVEVAKRGGQHYIDSLWAAGNIAGEAAKAKGVENVLTRARSKVRF